MNELIFPVTPGPEGGYTTRALGESIFTEADTLDELRVQIRDAVRCHFEEDQPPKILRLHIVQKERGLCADEELNTTTAFIHCSRLTQSRRSVCCAPATFRATIRLPRPAH